MIDTSALEPGTVIAGRYRVAEKIGHGGMGAVYLVQHVHTDEKLALKVLHPQVLRDASAVERFRREARAPAKITSEHVARVTDADTAPDLDGAPFYVMELLRGRDLERKLADDGPLSPTEVAECLRQAARALDKAHAIGIVHRDLKPENLFLTEREDGSPCIKLLDFGIARLADGDGPAKLSTQVGYIFGTPNYMAPEQVMGEPDKIGPQTDVWAIGLVAFKLLVGHEFFSGKSMQHLYAQILVEPLAAPSARGSQHGADFDAWFARCVTRAIPERFASVGEAAAALARALGTPLIERQSSPQFLPLRESDRSGAHAASSSGAFGVAAAPTSSNAVVGDDHPAIAATSAVALPTNTGGASKRLAVALGLGVVLVGGGVAFALRGASTVTPQGIVAASASLMPSARELAAPPAPSTAEPTASIAPAPANAPTTHGEPRAKTAGKSAANAAATSAPATKDDHAPLSREQKKRLEALERLCSQGTYTTAECQSKRAAITHGSH